MAVNAGQSVHEEGWFKGHGGLDLHYQAWTREGASTRAAVAIVHGIGEHSGAYECLVEPLSAGGFATYGFDLRGHGRSPGRRGFVNSWEDYRQDLRAFIQLVSQQRPRLPLFLLGHSLGGVIVLDYALRYPNDLSGVVAIAPAIGQVGIPPALMLLARPISRLWPAFSLNTGLDAGAISRDPRVVAAYRADPLVHNRGTARLAVETVRTAAWIQAHAAELRVPLLIQHGDADRLASPDGSRRFAANAPAGLAELREYPGGFHQLHHDICQDEVIRDIVSWLEHRLTPAPEP